MMSVSTDAKAEQGDETKGLPGQAHTNLFEGLAHEFDEFFAVSTRSTPKHPWPHNGL